MPIEPPREWGVTSNVCFSLGKQVVAKEIATATEGLPKKEAKKVAGALARGAAEKLAAKAAAGLDCAALPFVSRIEAEGAYLNFYYDATRLAGKVVGEVLEHGANYGKGLATGRRIMVEFAQPNTHKDFHIGHLRNASIGQAIANLLEFAGNDVLKATYLGDVGAHVAKAIWGEGQSKKDPPKQQGFFVSLPDESEDVLGFWGAVYKDASAWLSWLEEHRGDEAAIAKGRMGSWLKRWEQGDERTRKRWKASRDSCIEGFKQIFSELLLEFDEGCWFYESEIEDQKLGQQTADELRERGLALLDDSLEYKGALYVDLAEQTGNQRLGKMTILRSDGTSLYQTKELGLAKLKFDKFKIDESLYVVGAEQKFYFEQVTAILRLWGFPNANNFQHLTYELVVLPEGKMSSRQGNVVSYRELRNQAVKVAIQLTSEKGVAGDVADTAHKVAIASIKFAMLAVTASQQIVFDFDKALSFSGRCAPYLQYAYARAGKLTAGRSGQTSEKNHAPEHELHASEVGLARLIWGFPTVIEEAAAQTEPSTICTYLYELASAFSGFYRDCRVLNAPEPQREFRAKLCSAFRQVMATGFRLLALPLPEEM